MADFSADLKNFLNLLSTKNADKKLIKKKYIELAKTYHPDKAPENLKHNYSEYMILINKIYMEWETRGTVLPVKKDDDIIQKQANVSGKSDQVYILYPHYGTFVQQTGKPKKFTNYYEYLLNLGKDFYWQAHTHLLKDWGVENSNSEQTVYETLILLEKAKKCFEKLLKESPDQSDEYKFMIQNEIAKVYSMNNNITRGLSGNSTTEIQNST